MATETGRARTACGGWSAGSGRALPTGDFTARTRGGRGGLCPPPPQLKRGRMSNWHSAVSATAGGKPLQFSCGLVRSLGRTFLTSSGFARSIARIFLFLKCILVEGFRGSIPLWCRAGWGWRWDQRLPGLASPHIKTRLSILAIHPASQLGHFHHP